MSDADKVVSDVLDYFGDDWESHLDAVTGVMANLLNRRAPTVLAADLRATAVAQRSKPAPKKRGRPKKVEFEAESAEIDLTSED